MSTAPTSADQVVERTLADRQSAYEGEVERLVEAAHRVIARTDTLDPPIRAILTEAGLSNQAFYRHFRSKDELLLVLLDAGRRQLAAYLAHRMQGCTTNEQRLAEWTRGVLAQASDPDAAVRTRPFVTGVGRLQERFPDEQRNSEQLLIEQLADELGPSGDRAPMVYDTVMGALDRHLRAGTTPSASDIEAVIDYVNGGVG